MKADAAKQVHLSLPHFRSLSCFLARSLALSRSLSLFLSLKMKAVAAKQVLPSLSLALLFCRSLSLALPLFVSLLK